MSASLVGSEMCIRDSSRPRGVRPERRERRRMHFYASCCSEFQNIRDSPVSYTHLTLPTICSV
eukprot:6723871-Alexandrium_andersonii.AAC.1